MVQKLNDENFVAGHRQRVFQKFTKSGFLGWHDYEILEMALFYTIPRKDTKEIAKILLKKFGSISNILDADPKDLIEIKGISVYSASFFKFLKTFFIKLSEENLVKNFKMINENLNVINSTESAYNFLKFLIGANKDEEFVIIFLDNKNGIIGYESLSKGTIDEVVVYPRKLVERVLHHNAVGIILAHNHPSGDLQPSDMDKAITVNFKNVLMAIEVTLLDHLIISKNGFFSFNQHGLLDDVVENENVEDQNE
jgi:DNA repair protein RadC